jgi:hypothetical protein
MLTIRAASIIAASQTLKIAILLFGLHIGLLNKQEM